MIRIAAVDLSISETGLALLSVTDHAAEHHWQVGTVKQASLPVTAGPLREFGRMLEIMHKITYWFGEAAMQKPIDLVVMEGPAFSRGTGKAHERAGLWWHVYSTFINLGVTVLVIEPNLRAKYATGTGKAGKDAVVIAVTRRYPEAEAKTNNETDAVVLAAMGARHYGCPIEDRMPKPQLDAMKTVALG